MATQKYVVETIVNDKRAIAVEVDAASPDEARRLVENEDFDIDDPDVCSPIFLYGDYDSEVDEVLDVHLASEC